VTSVAQLVEGRVYFMFFYADEDTQFPDLTSWVYLGVGVLPEAGADRHVFQSVKSYCSDGKWTTLPEETRRRLGPETLLTFSPADVDLISDVDELQAHLAEYAAEVADGPDS
jgi:hypothetical protein